MLGCILHYVFIFIKVYNKSHRLFEQQNSQLLVRHYLATDISTANFASSARTKELILSGEQEIIYSLRNSAILSAKQQKNLALYRDDSQHNAVAIIEGLSDFQVQIANIADKNQIVVVTLFFKNSKKMELSFATRSTKRQ